MKTGIMQPYFFPYIGYFQLISAVDQWVVFDTAQYIRHGWINRNRILHPEAGPKYIVVPLAKHSSGTPIKDIRVNQKTDWKSRILAQVSNYYRGRAPFFSSVMDLLEQAIDDSERSLTQLLIKCLSAVCIHLKIPFQPILASGIAISRSAIEHPGHWALRISEAIGANKYINPIGGKGLFVPSEFQSSGIELSFLESKQIIYDQGRKEFCEHLSIIDVLMWNSAERTRELLQQFRIVRST